MEQVFLKPMIWMAYQKNLSYKYFEATDIKKAIKDL
jgi:hypothetical protein